MEELCLGLSANHRRCRPDTPLDWRMSECVIRNYRHKFQAFAIQRAKSCTEAMNSHAVAEVMVCSKSLAMRRLRLTHAKVRSTTYRLSSTSKPLAWSERLMISMAHFALPILHAAWGSVSPA